MEMKDNKHHQPSDTRYNHGNNFSGNDNSGNSSNHGGGGVHDPHDETQDESSSNVEVRSSHIHNNDGFGEKPRKSTNDQDLPQLKVKLDDDSRQNPGDVTNARNQIHHLQKVITDSPLEEYPKESPLSYHSYSTPTISTSYIMHQTPSPNMQSFHGQSFKDPMQDANLIRAVVSLSNSSKNGSSQSISNSNFNEMSPPSSKKKKRSSVNSRRRHRSHSDPISQTSTPRGHRVNHARLKDVGKSTFAKNYPSIMNAVGRNDVLSDDLTKESAEDKNSTTNSSPKKKMNS